MNRNTKLKTVTTTTKNTAEVVVLAYVAIMAVRGFAEMGSDAWAAFKARKKNHN